MVLGTARQMIELRQLGGYGGGGNGSKTKPCAAHQRHPSVQSCYQRQYPAP